MLTDVAPETFHNRVDIPPELIVDGLLLNVPTEGVATGKVVFGAGAGSEKQPGMRISSNNSDRERKINFFNVCTSKNILPEKSTRPLPGIVSGCLKRLIIYFK